jgi:hypothetical protein
MKHASGNELRSPRSLFFSLDLGEQLSVSILLSLIIQVSYNTNENHGLFTELSSFWVNVVKSEAEAFISDFILTFWNNLNVDAFLSLTLSESKGTFLWFVVLEWGSSVLG